MIGSTNEFQEIGNSSLFQLPHHHRCIKLKLQLDLVDIGLGHAGKTLKEIVASKTDLGSKTEASVCKVHSVYVCIFIYIYASYACTYTSYITMLLSSEKIHALKMGPKLFGEFFPIFWGNFFHFKLSVLLEVFSVKIVGSIARNDPFGSFFCEIAGSIAQNARFGTFFCEISRKPRAKRSFWNLLL